MMLFGTGFLIVGYLTASVAGFGADVVISCSLVEEGGGLGAMRAGGALFSRTPATLVLRDLAVSPDLSPETLTPYNPPSTPDPDDIIFEAKVTSPEIPEADSLLHADCNEQEVTCEISSYLPRGSEEGSEPAYFIGSVQLEGGGISLTLVLQTLPVTDKGEESVAPPLLQSKLKLPLSQSGTLLTEVVFVVFSRLQSLAVPLGGDALLDCGFKQQDPFPLREVGLEWRLQHRGSGRRILEMRAVETEEAPTVHVEREGSSVDPGLALEEGNMSLSLQKLKVVDEGTYICTVSAGLFQAQQIVQLHITQPPRVSLSVDTVIFRDGLPQKVSCHCERYYPLDVEVEWQYLLPTATEPVSLSQNVSLSSHRQYGDGTLSLSSHLTLHPFALPPGTTVTCLVSHSSLETPVSLSLTVSEPEPAETSYLMMVGLLAATLLFLYFVLR
ncbi:tapasin-related protein isoform X2 [Megalops cyprinoides]|uniref:tapasin-related protein isoform X2 n=1 Tax=Megalops cyprinoides TaxID=118141 RepID=UPI001864D6C5|nr:tapasin-related protein isoform X2 [Megalops cyprinoides]